MTRKLFSFLLVLALCLALVCPAMAYTSPVDDEADLLSAAEEAELAAQLHAIRTAHQVDVMVLTVNSTDGLSPDSFINRVFDETFGSDHDGVMLVVDMGSRNFRILSNGLAADAITMDDIDYITELITPYLSEGDYAQAFEEFASQCEYYINGHINGFPFPFGTNLVIALVIGFVVALIATGIMRGQLKSVHQKAAAGDYLKPGSLQITRSRDIFLYRHVSRHAKPKSNSSSSSSGGGRNVGGGSF